MSPLARLGVACSWFKPDILLLVSAAVCLSSYDQPKLSLSLSATLDEVSVALMVLLLFMLLSFLSNLNIKCNGVEINIEASYIFQL